MSAPAEEASDTDDPLALVEVALTAEHEALTTQATPAVTPEDSSPGRWRVPASARGRRPSRGSETAPASDDVPVTGGVSAPDQS